MARSIWIKGIYFLIICQQLLTNTSIAQIIDVQTVQNISFGKLVQQNNGGSLIMDSSGTISSTGDVYHMSAYAPYHPLIIEIEAYQGTNVSISTGPDTPMNGNNGGSITFTLGSSVPNSPFVIGTTPPNKTRITFGGTLMIGNLGNSPAGIYNGTFFVTFNNE